MRFIWFILLYLCLTFDISQAEEPKPCNSIIKTIPFRSSVATASFLANLRNRPGSLKYETSSMFNSAYKAVQEDKIQAPENLCPSYCKARPIAVFDFSSAPVKIRKNYRDKEKCSKHLIETRKTPIRYSDRKFDSLSAFKKWYHELSQGKGSDGKDLYKRCDGSCSPQYSFVISSSQGILNVTSTIICAHARDMSDNNYQVRSSFRWTCEEGDGEG